MSDDDDDDDDLIDIGPIIDLLATAILVVRGWIEKPPEGRVWAEWALDEGGMSEIEFAAVRGEIETMTPEQRGQWFDLAGLFDEFDA